MGTTRPDLAGGRLLAEITNRLVSLMREHYGHGPIKAKTYVLDDLIACTVTDHLTTMERTLVAADRPEEVLALRRHFQAVMKDRYIAAVEDATGRRVRAFLSQSHIEPDFMVEMFLMDGPLAGFGALAILDDHT